MSSDRPRRRPGGRSARVQQAVHDAVLELLEERSWADLSIPMVADRSGVHPATLYRRWGTLRELIGDALDHRLSRSWPMPDTGSLRGDLEGSATIIAENLAGPEGLLFLRAALLTTAGSRAEGILQPYLSGRAAEAQAALDRAAGRGEDPPTLREVFEVVIAPLYGYALLYPDVLGVDLAHDLVDRLMDCRRADDRKATGEPSDRRSPRA